ncbi:DNA double-strand break repair Rad50 ATPase [Biomphalaria glabrata]|nr:DNA double-strand break repair Rad50 ATPase [Biomphalaria glabrata]
MEEDNDDQFIHYTPQHPLPTEIQNLARDKTVCKYCGVSYLIHNEIKALEKKLKATEEELVKYKGLEKREALLQQELSLLKQQLEESKSFSETNSKLLIILTKEKDELMTQSKSNEEKIQAYRAKLLYTIRQFSTLNQSVKNCKRDVTQIKHQFSGFQSDTLEQLTAVLQNVAQIQAVSSKEVDTLHSKLQCLEMEHMVVAQSNKSLTESVKSQDSELQMLMYELNLKKSELEQQAEAYRKLEDNMEDVSKRLSSSQEVEVQLNDVSKELDNSNTQLRILTVELEQYKIHLKSKTSELNELMIKQKQMEQSHELAVQKLNTETKSKENELGACLKQIKSLEVQCQNLQRKELEMTQWGKLNSNEAQDLKEELKRTKSEVEALKSEREMMIEAHQNRIEELRESFKNKIAEAEGWPQKLQGALVAERSRYMGELKTLEENLKHQFVLELQIEKDKYDELMKKFQDQEKEKHNLKENHRALSEQKYKEEIEDLLKKVTDCKRRSSEREEELLKEISSLKKIINDLQDRSAKLDGSDSAKIKDLQNQLAQIHQEHLESVSQITLLEIKLKETSEEAQFLQGIVRKECEERFELTEALSEARKELLQLKKPAGGYSSVQKRGSTSSINSNSSTHVTSPVTLLPIEDPAIRSRASIQLNYSGDAKSPSDKTNDAQLQENRKRILNLMGRR